MHPTLSHKVHILSNEGRDTIEDACDIDAARVIIRYAKCASNLMVRLQVGERLVLRWDRILSARENRWRSMDLVAEAPTGTTRGQVAAHVAEPAAQSQLDVLSAPGE